MSWDIYLLIDTGGEELASIEGASWNYTYNTSPMLYDAGIDLHTYEGKTCKTVLPNFKKGLAVLRGNPIKYKKMNPKNGWGSYDRLVEILEQMVETFEKHPKAIIGAWF